MSAFPPPPDDPSEAGPHPPTWTPVTSSRDGVTHMVLDRELVAGDIDVAGVPTRCGRWILPGALSMPPGRRCPLCAGPETNGRTTRRAAGAWWRAWSRPRS